MTRPSGRVSCPYKHMNITNKPWSQVRTPHQRLRRHPQSPRPTPRSQERRIPLPTMRSHPARRRAPDDPPLPPPGRRQRPTGHHVPANAQEAQTKIGGLSSARHQHRLGRAPRRRLGREARVASRAAVLSRGEHGVCRLLGRAQEGFAGCRGGQWVCCRFDGACARDFARLRGLMFTICFAHLAMDSVLGDDCLVCDCLSLLDRVAVENIQVSRLSISSIKGSNASLTKEESTRYRTTQSRSP